MRFCLPFCLIFGSSPSVFVYGLRSSSSVFYGLRSSSSLHLSSKDNVVPSNSILKREYEDRLFQNGYNYIIGTDEAGRGPLAGPVVAAACCCPSHLQHKLIEKVNDSKLLSEKKRNEIYELIMNDNSILKAVTIIDNDKIDEINILKAALLAMELSIEKVTKQIQNSENDKICALVDGNKAVRGLPFKVIPVVRGDKLVYSIALASIIAKVERDRIMTQMHEIYPQYNFAQHKGYPTKDHFLLLHQYGPSPIHRKSTKPVQRILYNKNDDSNNDDDR